MDPSIKSNLKKATETAAYLVDTAGMWRDYLGKDSCMIVDALKSEIEFTKRQRAAAHEFISNLHAAFAKE